MAIVYKDINDFVQKPSISGSEKLPVSDTEFITPDQIVAGVEDELDVINRMVGKVTLTIEITDNIGKGYSNYQVVAGKTYKVKMTAKTGLANSYIFSGSGAPYTALYVGSEISWTPENSGVVGIYDNLYRTGSVDILIEDPDNLPNQINQLQNQIGDIETLLSAI